MLTNSYHNRVTVSSNARVNHNNMDRWWKMRECLSTPKRRCSNILSWKFMCDIDNSGIALL
jgi:hypothetical protein